MKIQIQMILIIHGFSDCELAYLPKFICNSKIQCSWHFPGHLRTCTKWWKLRVARHTFPAEVEQSYILPSCFSTHTVNSCPSMVYLVAWFWVSLFGWLIGWLIGWFCFLLAISLLHIWLPSVVLKCWSDVSMYKAVMCLLEKNARVR